MCGLPPTATGETMIYAAQISSTRFTMGPDPVGQMRRFERSRQRLGQELNGMQRRAAGASVNLMAARHAGGGNGRIASGGPHGREQPFLANGLRNLIMLRLIAE